MTGNMASEITAGDSLDFVDQSRAYPATDGWTLKYRLVPAFTGGGAAVIDLTASAQGADYRVQAGPAATAAWLAGRYTWARWVEKAGARQSLGTGELVIKPDPAAVAIGYDGRSVAKRTLDDLMAARSTWATTQGRVRSYSIAGRSKEFRDAAELDAEITFWRRQVADEDKAARLAAGLKPRNVILTRFGRAS